MQYPSYFWWFECFIILSRFTSELLFKDALSFIRGLTAALLLTKLIHVLDM